MIMRYDLWSMAKRIECEGSHDLLTIHDSRDDTYAICFRKSCELVAVVTSSDGCDYLELLWGRSWHNEWGLRFTWVSYSEEYRLYEPENVDEYESYCYRFILREELMDTGAEHDEEETC